MENKKIWFSDATEIGAAIGRSRYEIPNLVKNEDLPAFKFYGRWTALPNDIVNWTKEQRRKRYQRHSKKNRG